MQPLSRPLVKMILGISAGVMSLLLLFVAFGALNAAPATGPTPQKEPKQRILSTASPLNVILDTDMDGDNDDMAAAAILHALADVGWVEILAMGVVSRCPYSPACLDAINTYYGRGDIPIGDDMSIGRRARKGYICKSRLTRRCHK